MFPRLRARAKRLGLSLDEISELATIWDGSNCGATQERLSSLLVTKRAELVDRVVDEGFEQHRRPRWRFLGLDQAEVEQVVDDTAEALGLLDHAFGQRARDGRIGLRGDPRPVTDLDWSSLRRKACRRSWS